MSEMVERVAVALSMADPDERGLPAGTEMTEFYRGLARAAIAAMRYDDADEEALIRCCAIERLEAVSASCFWDLMIDDALEVPHA